MSARRLQVRGDLENEYKDVLTLEAVEALEALAGLDADRKTVMAARIARRAQRARDRQRVRDVAAGLTADAPQRLDDVSALWRRAFMPQRPQQ